MARTVYPELSGYSSRLKVSDVNRWKSDRCTQRFFSCLTSKIIDARNLAREKNQEKSQKLLIVWLSSVA